MRSLWIKIGLGAAGIFAVGMMGLTLVRSAKAAAVDAIHDAVAQAPAQALQALQQVEADNPAAAGGVERLAAIRELQQLSGSTIRSVDLPFRLDGAEIGWLTSGTIKRVRADALPVMAVDVQLTDAASRAQLEDCVLMPVRHRDSDFGGGFRCATNGDEGLVTFGTVRFTPGGFSRPLMITADQADEMRRGKPFEARANLHGGASVDVKGDRGELVRVRADENGANIRIHDEHGNDIFRLLADSLGASLRVRDKNGREVVRLSAGGGGFSMNIDTTSH